MRAIRINSGKAAVGRAVSRLRRSRYLVWLPLVALLAGCGKNETELTTSRQLLEKVQDFVAASVPTEPAAWPLRPEDGRLLVDRCDLLNALGAQLDAAICGPDGMYGAAARSTDAKPIRSPSFELSTELRATLLASAANDLAQIDAAHAIMLIRG